jgi:MraZ protein
MIPFLGSHQNRLDAKGRVSVPAPFRAVLKTRQDGGHALTNGNSINGNGTHLVLRPSHQHACIEAWPAVDFEALAAPLNQLALFSEAQDDLALALYAEAFALETDREGRIVLPDELVAFAGLGDQVTFLGAGRIFQIWEPEAAKRRRAEARERARANGFTLPGATPPQQVPG